MYTMKSAFKQWCILHDEFNRVSSSGFRVPNWFRWYIRNNIPWKYHVYTYTDIPYYIDNESDTNKYSGKYTRCLKQGYYEFDISDEELIKLERR